MPAQVASESAKPEPRVALSERGKLSYTVDIDSGNVVLRVPRNWSVQTQTQHRKQDSYDGIDADFRSFWEVEHSLYGVALLQEMVHEDGEVKLHQIRVVDLKLEDEKFPSARSSKGAIR